MTPSVLRAPLGALLAVLVLLVAAAPASAATGPPQVSFPAAFTLSQLAPDLDPPGANDFSCRPTAAHPRPVVLVHGTYENRYDNWAYLSPRIKAAGYCVFALDYGDDETSLAGLPPALKGTGDIRISSKELASYVDRVLAATGATQVDIVGHSQGGMMPRQYLKFDGGAGNVGALISTGATNHGTTLGGIGTLGRELGLLGGATIVAGPAAIQQVQGSEFLRNLNEGGDTVAGVRYTSVATRYDEVTTPYRSAFLVAGPGATVDNILLQDGCEIAFDDHLSMFYSPRVARIVLNALDPANRRPVPCGPRVPLF